MTKDITDTGIDPDEIFKEGVASGQEIEAVALREQMEEQLEGLGLEQDEIEALFDPAPRRKGKHRRGKIHCSKRQRETMPQICKGAGRRYDPAPRHIKRAHVRHSVSYYDPAPLRERVKRGSKKAKDIFSKLAKHEMAIGGVAALGTFLSQYSTRATALKAKGTLRPDGQPVNGIMDAIVYDYNNFSSAGGLAGVSKRLQADWLPILGGVGGGLAVKELVAPELPSKYRPLVRIVGDVLMGIGAGYAAKDVLDDNPQTNPVVMAPGSIQVVAQPAQAQPASQMSIPAYGVINRY